jgi:alpha-ribazole phosphatase/probable phosphoglycerate mutase
MSTLIILIRHGETAWNREKIFRGLCDIPLNKNGRLQAGHLSVALASRSIEVAYSSPLRRAMETATLVLEPHGVPVAVHEGLKDFDYGEWTGLADSEVADKWPLEHQRWLLEPHHAKPPGGDTLERILDAASASLESIVRKHAGQTIALFSHRVVNKLLILSMLGLGVQRFPFIRQDNCCVNEFERIERGYVVLSLNDTGHIRSAGTDLLKADF